MSDEFSGIFFRRRFYYAVKYVTPREELQSSTIQFDLAPNDSPNIAPVKNMSLDYKLIQIIGT